MQLHANLYIDVYNTQVQTDIQTLHTVQTQKQMYTQKSQIKSNHTNITYITRYIQNTHTHAHIHMHTLARMQYALSLNI